MIASCRKGCKLVQAYVDEEVDEQSAGVITRHLAECQQCRQEVTVNRRLREALRAQASVPESTVARLREFAHHCAEGQPPHGQGSKKTDS
jgi:anti-sigma factor RsiW